MPIINTRGYPMSTAELRTALGLPKKLPEWGRTHDIWSRQGYFIRLLPRGPKERGRRMEHRLQAQCKKCGRWVSAGRLFQHEKSCKTGS